MSLQLREDVDSVQGATFSQWFPIMAFCTARDAPADWNQSSAAVYGKNPNVFLTPLTPENMPDDFHGEGVFEYKCVAKHFDEISGRWRSAHRLVYYCGASQDMLRSVSQQRSLLDFLRGIKELLLRALSRVSPQLQFKIYARFSLQENAEDVKEELLRRYDYACNSKLNGGYRISDAFAALGLDVVARPAPVGPPAPPAPPADPDAGTVPADVPVDIPTDATEVALADPPIAIPDPADAAPALVDPPVAAAAAAADIAPAEAELGAAPAPAAAASPAEASVLVDALRLATLNVETAAKAAEIATAAANTVTAAAADAARSANAAIAAANAATEAANAVVEALNRLTLSLNTSRALTIGTALLQNTYS